MFLCYRCKREVSSSAILPHLDLCPYCASALHCCLNCLYYDEYAVNKCSEPTADWVPDKQKANFCHFFRFSEAPILKRPMEMDKARAYWESLWKKAQ